MRVALVGLGYISEYHYNAARKAGATGIIACDVNPNLTLAYADRPGVEATCASVDELAALKPDVAHVLTPPNLHYATASPLLAAGVDVLMEKPICDTSADSVRLIKEAEEHGALLGTSHNLLFYPIWDKAMAAITDGTIGAIRSIDVRTRRPFPPLRANDIRPWAMRATRNALFEAAPHSFAFALDLVREIELDVVHPSRPQELPNGVRFFRQYDVIGHAGDTTVRFDLSWDDAFSESYVHVRGTVGSIIADFNHNTVQILTRSFSGLDAELAQQGVAASAAQLKGAAGTFLATIARKAGANAFGPPMELSIERATERFYADRVARTALDRRLSPDLALRVVGLGEAIEERAELSSGSSGSTAPTGPAVATRPAPAVIVTRSAAADPSKPRALVLGGTGFIGAALVRRLAADGVPTKVVARNESKARAQFAGLASVEVVAGDLEQTAALLPHLDGIDVVYHLARSLETSWEGLLRTDLEPTKRLADACVARGIKRFVYASSIAIYDAGDPANSIVEDTPASPGVVKTSTYARSKAEAEAYLLELHRTKGFPVVIMRPAIVLGEASDPNHWGVASWRHSNVAVHWGSGQNKLPIVLVDDVADAFAKALDTPGIEGRSFNLSSPGCITADEYLEELGRASGGAIRRKPQAAASLYALAIAKWAMKLPGSNRQPFPAWADAKGRSFASPFDCTATERALDWHPEKDPVVLLRKAVTEPAKAWTR